MPVWTNNCSTTWNTNDCTANNTSNVDWSSTGSSWSTSGNYICGNTYNTTDSTTWVITAAPADGWAPTFVQYRAELDPVERKILDERALYQTWSKRAKRRAEERAEEVALGLLEELFGSVKGVPYLVVPSGLHPDQRYHIPTNGDMVELWEGNKKVCRLCAHPKGDLPSSDEVITRRLMLELSEKAFLEVANIHAWGYVSYID